MTPYGLVDVRGDSEPYLLRVLELANRLSQTRTVVLRLEPGTRHRVEAMLDGFLSSEWRERIEFLEGGDPATVSTAVQAAGFCLFSDTGLASHLRADQVAVYSPAWTA